MQDTAAKSYAQLISDRIATISLPPEFRTPDIVIGEGTGVKAAPATGSRPRPVLTVGEHLATFGTASVQRGLIACEIAHTVLGTPERRATERAGSWAPHLLRLATVVFLIGLLIESSWLVFAGGMGLTVGLWGLHLCVHAARAARTRTFDADEQAAEWVGRQAVADALHWQCRMNATPPHPTRQSLTPPLRPPTPQERLHALGA